MFCMTLCLHLTLLQSAATVCDLVENTVLERKSVYAHPFVWYGGKREQILLFCVHKKRGEIFTDKLEIYKFCLRIKMLMCIHI